MARGGRRAGNRGAAYGNRTDLHTPLPPSAPNGLPYGARGELISAQRQVPMAPAPGAGMPQQAPPQQPSVIPGMHGDFLRPTERPNEPVTAGIPMGAGPGPEALTGVGAGGFGHAATADLLTQLAAVPGAGDDVRALANYAQQGRG